MNQLESDFWSVPVGELLLRLQTKIEGLTAEEADQRILRYRDNLLKPKKRNDVLTLLFAQFKDLSQIFAVRIDKAG